MKDKPEPNQMLLDDSWDDLPVIQRQEEFLAEEAPENAQETLPVEDPQAVDASPTNGEPADPSPPDTNLKLFQAGETKESAPEAEDLQPIDRPSEQVEEPASIALAEATNGDAATEALLDPPEVAQTETPPSVLKPKITQVEAMRQALIDLGLTAKNAALAEYLQDKFGLLPKNIAVLKSTVKKTYFSRPEPIPQDQAAPEQTATTESIQEVVAPESNGVLGETEPVLAESVLALPSEAVIPEPAVSQVNTTEEPPPEYLVDDLAEPEMGPTQEPSVALDGEPEEPIKDLEPVTYSMEEVMAVKGLCDRMGVETFLALIDILG